MPHPDSPLLRAIVETASSAVRDGEMTVDQGLLYAAVHGWMEGQIAGVDGGNA